MKLIFSENVVIEALRLRIFEKNYKVLLHDFTDIVITDERSRKLRELAGTSLVDLRSESSCHSGELTTFVGESN